MSDPQEPTGWQPMTSAPVGERVLILDRKRGRECAVQHPVYGWISQPGRYSCVPAWWMPLPLPINFPASEAAPEGTA